MSLRADVDDRAHVGAAVHDQVSLEGDIAALDEARISCFLKDAQDPLLGVIDRVVAKDRAVNTDEGDSRLAATEDVALDGDAPGFAVRIGWAEVRQPGRSPAVYGASAGAVEAAV